MPKIERVMTLRATIEMARHCCQNCGARPLGIPNGEMVIMTADSPTGTSEYAAKCLVPTLCLRCKVRGKFEISAILRKKDNKIVQYSPQELARIFAKESNNPQGVGAA